MVSTRNTSKSHTNPPRMQDQQGDVDSQPPVGTPETIKVNTDEMEALRLTNQRLLRELEQLTKKMQRPQEARQARESPNPLTQEEQQHLDPPRGADGEGETSQTKECDPYKPPGENRNGERHGRDNMSNGPVPILDLQETRERSWEQRFRGIQQELSHIKEVLKGQALVSMDALVQQIESPFTARVLHFPLPAKFRMSQVETFNGIRDPIDHLNTYKNQMELYGYQDSIRCRAFTITLKGPALAWFNRLPSVSISSFTELSITFVSHFIGARMYKKPSYHLLTIKQSSQESLRSYVQRFNAESLKVVIPDEKFANTSFIVELGVQSKDLMFSISKNPQASMVEVLAKTEKYINGEEALLSMQRSSSTRKEKSRGDKKRERSPRRQADRDRSPRRSRENRERSPKRRGNVRDRLGPPQPKL